jgi:AraC-like DNA-binding protein
MSGTVRAETSARLLELIAALGGSPERVLAAAGVTAADLADLDRPIEMETEIRLVDAAAHQMGDDYFGLHAGSLLDFQVLGVLTYAVLNAPTVGTGLRNFERYARLHFRGPRISVGIDGHEAQLSFVVDVPDGVPRRQHAEGSAVIGLRIMRCLIGPDWRPRRVLFAHDRPRDTSEHERSLGAPLRFRQPVHFGLVFDAADLERPVPGADRRLLPIIERHLDELLATPDPDDAWLGKVRSAIATSVCDGHPGIPTVARRLGLSVRTLQRRLGEQGAVFKSLIEDVRRELALRYLADGRTRLTDVAFLVGYSELSAFGRAFKRWTGSTPLAVRQNLTAPPGTRA